jgi:hypothetical protein
VSEPAIWTKDIELFEDWIKGGRGRRGGRGREEKEVNVVGDIMFIVGGKNLLLSRFPGSDF